MLSLSAAFFSSRTFCSCCSLSLLAFPDAALYSSFTLSTSELRRCTFSCASRSLASASDFSFCAAPTASLAALLVARLLAVYSASSSPSDWGAFLFFGASTLGAFFAIGGALRIGSDFAAGGAGLPWAFASSAFFFSASAFFFSASALAFSSFAFLMASNFAFLSAACLSAAAFLFASASAFLASAAALASRRSSSALRFAAARFSSSTFCSVADFDRESYFSSSLPNSARRLLAACAGPARGATGANRTATRKAMPPSRRSPAAPSEAPGNAGAGPSSASPLAPAVREPRKSEYV
mmetsp:Transcript_52454/g.145425  ORF Transcript_52454/g.145425 Transcript_52454/m.145425 type:complete len:296 (+) Transcript_52454:706-1593(+)